MYWNFKGPQRCKLLLCKMSPRSLVILPSPSVYVTCVCSLLLINRIWKVNKVKSCLQFLKCVLITKGWLSNTYTEMHSMKANYCLKVHSVQFIVNFEISYSKKMFRTSKVSRCPMEAGEAIIVVSKTYKRLHLVQSRFLLYTSQRIYLVKNKTSHSLTDKGHYYFAKWEFYPSGIQICTKLRNYHFTKFHTVCPSKRSIDCLQYEQHKLA